MATPQDRLKPDVLAFESVCDTVGVGLWRWDCAGETAWANAATRQLFGVGDFHGVTPVASFLTHVHPDDLPLLQAAMESHAEGLSEAFQCEFRICRPSGEVWLRACGKAESREGSGRAVTIIGATVDVTSEVAARQASSQAEQRLNDLSENVADMVFELVRSSRGEYRLTYVNAGVRDLFGVPEAEAKEDFVNLLETVQPRFHLRLMADLALSAETLSPWHCVFCVNHPRRGPIWAEGHAVPVQMGDGEICWHGSVRDITERQSMEQELAASAHLDPLTGLANRSLFLDRLQDALLRGKTTKSQRFAVLFIDVDSFKSINDSLGHSAGDELLVQMARRLNRYLRTDSSTSRRTLNDTAARLGGDEFIALVQNLSAAQAERIAKRLVDALGKPYKIAGTVVLPTVSIGIVEGGEGYDDASAVMRDADIAVFAAKSDGRGCFRMFDSDLRASAMRRMRLEQDLRTALHDGEMHLVYQPVVSLETEALEWVEALLRWNHPTLGPVSPAEFIPIAEESGTVSQLGDWVINEACRQWAAWNSESGHAPQISVNLSRDQLADFDLVHRVTACLDKHQVPAEAIHFEITESTVMRDPAAAQIILSELRSRGHHLSLDDFGTGYSSLSSLHQFPLDYLKIDKSFVKNLSMGDDYVVLIRAMTRLAAVLDIGVVVEGVETEEQLEKLRPSGCGLGQGFLFGRPMSPEELAEYARDQLHLRKAA